jgi:hypothetical protein
MTRKLSTIAACLAALALAAPALAGPRAHGGLGDDPFAGVDVPGDFAAAAAPPASVPSVAGCSTSFISHNFSSRGGIRPRLLVLHYTVSPNRDGWGDIDLIRGLFNRDSFDASSTFLIDFEGHCRYIVNEAAKPWTQTFYNPWSISVEIIATGKEPKSAWLASRGLVKTAQVLAGAARRWGIPIRWVDPGAACVAPPAGVTDHNALDCQNSHTDVRPNFPYKTFMRLLEEAANPQPRFRFVATNESGTTLARSAPFKRGGGAGAEQFRSFLRNHGDEALDEIRRDGDVRIKRVKVG